MKEIAKLHYYKEVEGFLLGDIDELLEIVNYSPEADVTLKAGEEQLFEVEVISSDEKLLELNWFVDGDLKGTGREFIFKSEEPGDFVIKLTASDSRLSKSIEWNIGVEAYEKMPEEKPEEEEKFVPEEKEIENLLPVLKINSPEEGEVISGKYNIKWEAYDPEGEPLEITIKISGKTFYIENTGNFILDTEEFDNGKYYLQIQAGDGENTITSGVSVVINNPEKPVITEGEIKEETVRIFGISPAVLLISFLLISLSFLVIYIIWISGLLEKKPREELEEL